MQFGITEFDCIYLLKNYSRSLLALACSVILPVDKMVRKYLLAHLKKCSADFVTEEGKYARFAEKVSDALTQFQFTDLFYSLEIKAKFAY
jgi:hypothetical protein